MINRILNRLAFSKNKMDISRAAVFAEDGEEMLTIRSASTKTAYFAHAIFFLAVFVLLLLLFAKGYDEPSATFSLIFAVNSGRRFCCDARG